MTDRITPAELEEIMMRHQWEFDKRRQIDGDPPTDPEDYVKKEDERHE